MQLGRLRVDTDDGRLFVLRSDAGRRASRETRSLFKLPLTLGELTEE